MNLYFRLRYIRRKSWVNKGSRRRFKRVASGRKSISCTNPTQIYIPLDLQIDTLLRLPVESLLRFRCVSKLWSSIITSRDFRNQHLNINASSVPHLLIAFKDFYGNNLMLVSLPNPNAYSSSCRVPFEELRQLKKVQGKLVYNSVRGLICVGKLLKVGAWSPSTRKLYIFPQLRFEEGSKYPRPKYFFGYDPVEDQYKVLAIDRMHMRGEHKIAVLGGGGWRDVSVSCKHYVQTAGLYMNGTMYYGAFRTDIDTPNDSIIVSFNVRLETFNIIKLPSKHVPVGHEFKWKVDLWPRTDKTLINYQGKIGVVEDPREGSFRMWVVEDAEKEEWSINTFHLPHFAAGFNFKVMDTFYTGEICLVRKELPDPFCLFYYNLKTNIMRSVTIEGLPMSDLKQAHDYLSVTVFDHYES